MCLSFDTAPLIIMDTYFFSFSRSRISVSNTSSLVGAGGAGGAAGAASAAFFVVSFVMRRINKNIAKAIKSQKLPAEIVRNPEIRQEQSLYHRLRLLPLSLPISDL